MESLSALLEKSTATHSHLCPRQILGVRMGLFGLRALGFEEPPANKRLLVIIETDGCFADGLSAATGCTVGHRTLRVEDFGKTGAVFVDTLSGQTLRLAPLPGIRQLALAYAPGETQHYAAQLRAYQVMPDEVMFSARPVLLNVPVTEIVSRPGLRVQCARCGEEIINERQVAEQGVLLCRACAGQAYYHF